MFIIDAHLDLSMNVLEWNRDLRASVSEINAREAGLTDKPDRGKATVSLPELRKGSWHSPQQTWGHTQAQLAWYKAIEEP